MILSLLGSTLAFATDGDAEAGETQPMETSLGYQEQVQSFFTDLDQGEYGRAIETLYAGNPWMKAEDLAKVKAQFESLPGVLGELHSKEFLSEQKIGERYVFLWYVASFDRSPVSLYFKFYKPEGSWRFYSFEYKEDLSQIARDLAIRQLEQVAD
jgi:hypothetical protein